MIDSHAHLDLDRFDDDRQAVIDRAHAAGVDMMISIGTSVKSSQAAYDLACEYPSIFRAGIHPHDVDEFDDTDFSKLEALDS